MKFGYFLLLALIVVQYVLFFPSPLSGEEAITDVLRWAVVDSPGEKGNVIVSPSDIVVAPDQAAIVAVVTSGRKAVFISDDAGATWYNTSVPAITGEIWHIDISTSYQKSGTALVRDLGIGTADWDGLVTNGQVWTAQFGENTISAWKNQNIAAGYDVSAIAFAPSYKENQAILAVASTTTDTRLCIGERDLDAQTTKWNNISGYPVDIVNSGDSGPDILSNIAMPDNYSAILSTRRVTFVSFYRDTVAIDADDNIYRINDSTSEAMGLNEKIYSISLYGSVSDSGYTVGGDGILLAGAVDADATGYAVPVYRCNNPFAVPPASPAWQEASQPPSGPGNACVSWNYDGTAAYCGTGTQSPVGPPDESAFSRSYDNGNTWEQVSLINTVLNISDIAPAPDSKSLFLASYSDYGPEGIWRSAGEPMGSYWGRILTVQSDNTTAERIILRLSADYLEDFTLYAIPLGSHHMYVTHTRGNSWWERYIPDDVVDVAVESRDILYVALEGGKIRKSTDGGQIWQDNIPTGLDEINMISIPMPGHLLVGGRDGRVAYSTDGGATFTRIDEFIADGSGDVQVVGDANYSENAIIYAATNTEYFDTNLDAIIHEPGDEGIWRWVIGSSDEWEQIDKTVTDLGNGQQVSGLLTGEEGTLYALRAELSDPGITGGMSRTLNPYAPEVLDIEFDVVNATIPAGVKFDPLNIFVTISTAVDPELRDLHCHTLPHLKMSEYEGMNCLWALDTANTVIYRFNDTLCKKGPALSEFDFVGCDPASGRNQEFSLVWEQLSLSDEYEVHVGKDTIFSLRVGQTEPDENPFYPPVVVTSPAYCIAAAQALECGHTFYWRIRTRHAITGETIRSPWSIVSDFDVKAGFPVTTEYYGVQLLSPDNGCGCPCESPACFSWSPYKETDSYLFELSEKSDMSKPLVSDTVTGSTAYQYTGNLKCNTNYFWRVIALEPVESEWSAVFSFMTQEREMPAMRQREIQTSDESKTPVWVWVLIALGTIGCANVLVISLHRMKQF
ncbi:MAG: hypothetical protein P8105_04475 [Dehalococcoidia bacterium]